MTFIPQIRLHLVRSMLILSEVIGSVRLASPKNLLKVKLNTKLGLLYISQSES